MSKNISKPNNTFVRHIIRHYLKYDKENPFIFISAMLAFLGIASGCDGVNDRYGYYERDAKRVF